MIAPSEKQPPHNLHLPSFMEKETMKSWIANRKVTLLFELYGSTGVGCAWEEFAPRTFAPLWAEACLLPSNKALCSLDRVEGGLCNEDLSKQLRFLQPHPTKSDPKIDINVLLRDGDWTMEEAYDLKQAFILAMERLMGTDLNRERLKVARDKYDSVEDAFFRDHPNSNLSAYGKTPQFQQALRVYTAAQQVKFPGGSVRGRILIE